MAREQDRPKFKINDLTQAVRFLKAGKAVVYPTDTAYGLGVDATNLKAVKRLYRIKGRKFNQPVHIVVGSMAQARKYVVMNKLSKKLYRRFLPGPLTLVLPLKKRVGRAIRLLSAGTGTLGIREPDHKTAIALVKKLHAPITTTSANRAGGKAPYRVKDAKDQFLGRKDRPDFYLDEGSLPMRKPSTMVRVISNNEVNILRMGEVSKQAIQKVILAL